MVSRTKDIQKKLGAVRSKTRAEIAKKLAKGLPIASMEDGKMAVEQLVEVEQARHVTKTVRATEMAAKVVAPAKRARPAKSKATEKRAAAAR